mmetsp:Transcript_95782/g.276663  ORF Transcript_95782/g.276663 Transcript_95782/m.276663 type:complete len:247 (+) Transcript_95782:342-1082(+)
MLASIRVTGTPVRILLVGAVFLSLLVLFVIVFLVILFGLVATAAQCHTEIRSAAALPLVARQQQRVRRRGPECTRGGGVCEAMGVVPFAHFLQCLLRSLDDVRPRVVRHEADRGHRVRRDRPELRQRSQDGLSDPSGLVVKSGRHQRHRAGGALSVLPECFGGSNADALVGVLQSLADLGNGCGESRAEVPQSLDRNLAHIRERVARGRKQLLAQWEGAVAKLCQRVRRGDPGVVALVGDRPGEHR